MYKKSIKLCICAGLSGMLLLSPAAAMAGEVYGQEIETYGDTGFAPISGEEAAYLFTEQPQSEHYEEAGPQEELVQESDDTPPENVLDLTGDSNINLAEPQYDPNPVPVLQYADENVSVFARRIDGAAFDPGTELRMLTVQELAGQDARLVSDLIDRAVYDEVFRIFRICDAKDELTEEEKENLYQRYDGLLVDGLQMMPVITDMTGAYITNVDVEWTYILRSQERVNHFLDGTQASDVYFIPGLNAATTDTVSGYHAQMIDLSHFGGVSFEPGNGNYMVKFTAQEDMVLIYTSDLTFVPKEIVEANMDTAANNPAEPIPEYVVPAQIETPQETPQDQPITQDAGQGVDSNTAQMPDQVPAQTEMQTQPEGLTPIPETTTASATASATATATASIEEETTPTTPVEQTISDTAPADDTQPAPAPAETGKTDDVAVVQTQTTPKTDSTSAKPDVNGTNQTNPATPVTSSGTSQNPHYIDQPSATIGRDLRSRPTVNTVQPAAGTDGDTNTGTTPGMNAGSSTGSGTSGTSPAGTGLTTTSGLSGTVSGLKTSSGLASTSGVAKTSGTAGSTAAGAATSAAVMPSSSPVQAPSLSAAAAVTKIHYPCPWDFRPDYKAFGDISPQLKSAEQLVRSWISDYDKQNDAPLWLNLISSAFTARLR